MSPRNGCGQGGVAVVPTDTVYGLAARPVEAEAVRAIYRMKGRPEGMHLPVLAASVGQVHALGVAFTSGAEALARRWWPGPLTLAFGFEPGLERPSWLDGPHRGGRAHPRPRLPARRSSSGPACSSSPAPTRTARPRRAAPGTWRSRSVPAVDLIVDGGELQDVPSTLVNVREPEPSVEREGAIPRRAIDGRCCGGPGEPDPAGHRDVVRRDGGGRRRRRPVGALFRGRQPDRPARRPSAGSYRSWPAAPTSRP